MTPPGIEEATLLKRVRHYISAIVKTQSCQDTLLMSTKALVVATGGRKNNLYPCTSLCVTAVHCVTANCLT